MRTITIVLTSGKEINLVNTTQKVSDILAVIAEEKTDYILIEGHSAINKHKIEVIVDKSKVDK